MENSIDKMRSYFTGRSMPLNESLSKPSEEKCAQRIERIRVAAENLLWTICENEVTERLSNPNYDLRNSIWPRNILVDILQINPLILECLDSLPEDFEESLEYVLKLMSDQRAVAMLRMRYKQRKSWEEIGEGFSLSGERVRQIVKTQIQMLRSPSRLKYLKLGLKNIANTTGNPSAFSHSSQKAKAQRMSLEELNLSNRTYNCLRRVGVKTVADILKMDYLQISSIKNLGKRSLSELIGVLESNGFDCSDLTEDTII